MSYTGTLCLFVTLITLPLTAYAQWDPAPGQPGVTSTGFVRASYGNSTHLYIGGSFTQINGVNANRIARFDGSTWTTMGDGIASDVLAIFEYDYGDGPVIHAGGLNGLNKWNGESWVNAGITQMVRSWAVYDNGSGPTLYVGGNYTQASGKTVNRIARWNAATEQWDAIGSGINGPVSALKVWDDGSGEALYAGGNFTTSGGVNTAYISRLKGSQFESVGGGMAQGSTGSNIPAVTSLVVFNDGLGEKLFAGGQFGEAGGVVARFMAYWNGSVWAPVAGGFNGVVDAMAISGGETGDFLYAGGQFTSAIPSVSVDRIARWTGSEWVPLYRADSLSFGVNGFVNTLTDWDTGTDRVLVAGGQFALASGLPASRLAFYREQAPGSGGTGGPDDQFENDYAVVNTNDSGVGSFRWAVDQANAGSARDRISFNIPGTGPHIIQPLSQFISFTHPVIVDATTQPGYTAGTPVIVLNGSQSPEGANGLVFTVPAGESIVRGLSIVGYKRLSTNPFTGGNAIQFLSNGNRVEGNFIGLLPDGAPDGNTGTGIVIDGGSDNLIGGQTPAQRNVISANTTGIDIRNGASGNNVEGNYIGTNPAGSEGIGNRFNMQIIGSSGNRIGGSADGAGNLISGAVMVESSGGSGVVIAGSGGNAANNNEVSGNLIGTNASGTAAIPNKRAGILLLFNANNNTIGGSSGAHRNIISGNEPYGIFMQANETAPVTGNLVVGNYIGLNINGAPLGNTYGILTFGDVGLNRIGNAEYPGNVISGNAISGIHHIGGSGLLIQNNLIGTTPDGNSAAGNTQDGIYLATSGNTVGGSGFRQGNVISGNLRYGINLQADASGNIIHGNFIGLTINGTAAVGNTLDGIVITSSGNAVGGTGNGERNIISGNLRHGINLQGNGASANNISGNFIGLDAAGTTGVGNGRFGIILFDAPENQIAGNVISHNGQAFNSAGIDIFGPGSVGNLIRSNLIGTNADGTQAIGNQGAGITVRALNNTIGGVNPVDGNTISGNSTQGILITTFFGDAGQTTIRNNRIGVGANGITPMGNASDGILIAGSSNNMIGGESGITAAYPNTIANNGRIGVAVITEQASVPVSNAILGNSIYGNALAGIDLGANGRTLNDDVDNDEGPNRLQNYPVISNLAFNDALQQFSITYSVPSSPDHSAYPLRIEFFLTDGGSQGKTYIGFDEFTTDDSGTEKTVEITLLSTVTVPAGSAISATATDNDLNTSEFGEFSPTGIVPADWTLVDLPTGERLQAIYFTDALTGWAGGTNGTLFKTTNGGESWINVSANYGFLDSIVQEIQFIDRHRGWASGTKALVARTTNGGLSWTRSGAISGTFSAIHFINADKGFLAGNNGAFYRSSDGGATWVQQTVPTILSISKIQFITDKIGFMLAFDGVLKTTDGGDNWTMNPVPSGTMLAMHFFNENEGFVAGLNGIIYFTDDSGATFTPASSPTFRIIYNMAFADRNTGWLVGDRGVLASTTDGGESWESVPTSTTDLFDGLYPVRTNYVWASGPLGYLYRFGSAGNVILDDFLAQVTRNINSNGSYLFNEGESVTGVTVTVDNASSFGDLIIRREEVAPDNFDWSEDAVADLANVRWHIYTDGAAAPSYTIRFDMDEIPGLPIYDDINNLAVLRRDNVGSGIFEVMNTRIIGNSLFVTTADLGEFAIVRSDVTVDIGEPGGPEVPADYLLHQNYPNPFNPSTTIRFELPESVPVTLEVFTVTGQRVAHCLMKPEGRVHIM
jgi:trimeric autotransporter adhesin